MEKNDALAIRCIQSGYTTLVIEETGLTFAGKPVTIRFGRYNLNGKADVFCYAATIPSAEDPGPFTTRVSLVLGTNRDLGHLKAGVKRLIRSASGETPARTASPTTSAKNFATAAQRSWRPSTMPEAPTVYEMVGLSWQQVERIVDALEAAEYKEKMQAYRQRLLATGVIRPKMA